MDIKFLMTEEEIEELPRHYINTGLITQIADRAAIERRLQEAGIENAEVDFVRDNQGLPFFGGFRVPLKISSPSGNFVLKKYDHHSPKRERKVLDVVQGQVAPQVLYFGNDFYIEGLIDRISSTTLAEIALDNLEEAIKLGAKAHADLAKRRINYDHDHWLDEFHQFAGRTLITDFGTSKFFKIPGEDEYFDEQTQRLTLQGISSFLSDYSKIPCFERNRPRYSETMRQIGSLDQDSTTLHNLICVLGTTAKGIKRFIEQQGLRPRKTGTAWDTTMELFPTFVEAFAERYTSD